MIFQDIVLKQEEVVASVETNWATFWWVFFICMVVSIIILGICLIFTDDNVKMKCGVFGITAGACAVVFSLIAFVISSSYIGGTKYYETHYTVEAETFYKSEFTKDYEVVLQDGKLLVVREVSNE